MGDVLKRYILIFLLLFCSKPKQSIESELLFAHVANLKNEYSLAEKAVQKWDLNIKTKTKVYSDNTEANVITHSENLVCDDLYVSDSIKTKCKSRVIASPYSVDNLIGFTLLEYNASGKIQTSHIILNDSTVFSQLSESDKIKIISHEMGHALGLKHVNDPNNIMYNIFEKDREVSYEPQRSVLKRLYNGENLTTELDSYFIKIYGNYLMHETLPIYFISFKRSYKQTQKENFIYDDI